MTFQLDVPLENEPCAKCGKTIAASSGAVTHEKQGILFEWWCVPCAVEALRAWDRPTAQLSGVTAS